MKRSLRLLLVLGLLSAMIAAQDAPKHIQKVYKVVFLIYEMEDGKKINERTYTLPVNTVDGNSRDGSIRVGTRVPIETGTNSSDKTMIQYIDVGLDLDCNVTEQEDKFIVHGSVTLSSLVPPEQGTDLKGSGMPVLRQIKQIFTTLVSPGKPTLATTLDDINSKKRMQVEITATRLN